MTKMIRVTLELIPGGLEEHKQTLGVIEIMNNLVETIETEGNRGSYIAIVHKKRTSKKVRIRNYPRKAYHPWELVRRVLNEAHSG